MKFNYLTVSGVFDTGGKFVRRPMLEVELIHDDKIIHALGHIDSGADTTTLNSQYATALGMQLDKMPRREIIGVGNGRVTVYTSTMQFKINKTDITMKILVWFVDSENVNILFGQEGFFDQFKIKFDKSNNIFELTESKK